MKDFSLRRTSSREPAHKKFLNRAARAGRAILQSGTKIGLKAATLGVLDAADLDDLKSIADDIAEEASTKTGEYIKALLSRHGEERKNIEDGQSRLQHQTLHLPAQDRHRMTGWYYARRPIRHISQLRSG